MRQREHVRAEVGAAPKATEVRRYGPVLVLSRHAPLRNPALL
jgi:hypothetical protein